MKEVGRKWTKLESLVWFLAKKRTEHEIRVGHRFWESFSRVLRTVFTICLFGLKPPTTNSNNWQLASFHRINCFSLISIYYCSSYSIKETYVWQWNVPLWLLQGIKLPGPLLYKVWKWPTAIAIFEVTSRFDLNWVFTGKGTPRIKNLSLNYRRSDNLTTGVFEIFS